MLLLSDWASAALAAAVFLAGTASAQSGITRTAVSPFYPKYTAPLVIPPVKTPIVKGYTHPTTGQEMDFYEVEIRPVSKQIFPGLGRANMLGYDGIIPGPTFKVKKGRETVIRFVNKDSTNKTIHLHGSATRAPWDGWAMDMIPQNYYKDYYYPNKQNARTIWYHDHAMDITSTNMQKGLSGMYIIEDELLDRRFHFPSGKYDVPLILSSAFFTPEGDVASVAEETDSSFGDTFMVNGTPWPYMNVEPRKYRFRLLNSAISRTFNLSLSEDIEGTRLNFTVIGADAGLSRESVDTKTLLISMAERWDVIIDFRPFMGKNVTMVHTPIGLPFFDIEYTRDGALWTDSLMQFRVGYDVTGGFCNNGMIPKKLVDRPEIPRKARADQNYALDRIGTTGNFVWTISNRRFSQVENRIIRNVPRGTVEQWQFSTGGPWSHPFHIHLVDFEIVSRPGWRGIQPYERHALKDVVTTGQGETVNVIAHYAPYAGVYMFHCHNAIHEDKGMMLAFNVSQLVEFGYPESTASLENPLDERFLAKPYTVPATSQEAISNILPFFGSLRAYEDMDGVVGALKSYHQTRTPATSGRFISTVRTTATLNGRGLEAKATMVQAMETGL